MDESTDNLIRILIWIVFIAFISYMFWRSYCSPQAVKRRKIRKHVKSVSKNLNDKYGRKDKYSYEEVREASQNVPTTAQYGVYGMCTYLAADQMDELVDDGGFEMPADLNYEAVRQEVSDNCFNGNSDFSTDDSLDFSERDNGWGDDSEGDSDSSSSDSDD